MLWFLAKNAVLYQMKNNKKMLTLGVKRPKYFRGKALIPHQELVRIPNIIIIFMILPR